MKEMAKQEIETEMFLSKRNSEPRRPFLYRFEAAVCKADIECKPFRTHKKQHLRKAIEKWNKESSLKQGLIETSERWD